MPTIQDFIFILVSLQKRPQLDKARSEEWHEEFRSLTQAVEEAIFEQTGFPYKNIKLPGNICFGPKGISAFQAIRAFGYTEWNIFELVNYVGNYTSQERITLKEMNIPVGFFPPIQERFEDAILADHGVPLRKVDQSTKLGPKTRAVLIEMQSLLDGFRKERLEAREEGG